MKELTTSEEMTNAIEAALEVMSSSAKYNVQQFIDQVSSASAATFSIRLFLDALKPLLASGRVRCIEGRHPDDSRTVIAWYEVPKRVYS